MKKDNLILYSTGCPNCLALKRMLDKYGIKYAENNSVEEMRRLNISFVPVLRVNGISLLDYNEAVEYVMNLEKVVESCEKQ